MSNAQTVASLYLWQAVKHVQSRSPVTLTDSEVLRLMGIPLDAAEALVEIKSLRAEVERLRAELGGKE